MLANVFTKTLRDQRRSLIGWSIGIATLILVEGALWPSVRDMPNLDEFLASYPEALKEAFNLGAMTTGTGFLNAELYTLVLPILFLVFGISRGARLVAGEEEAGTLEAVDKLTEILALLDKPVRQVVLEVAVLSLPPHSPEARQLDWHYRQSSKELPPGLRQESNGITTIEEDRFTLRERDGSSTTWTRSP